MTDRRQGTPQPDAPPAGEARALLARLVEAWNNHDRGPIAIADIFREAEALLAAPECTCDMGEGPPMPRCVVHTPPAPSAIEAAVAWHLLDRMKIAAIGRQDFLCAADTRQAQHRIEQQFGMEVKDARVLALARPPLSRAEAEGMVERVRLSAKEIEGVSASAYIRDQAHCIQAECAALLAALTGGNDAHSS